MMTGLFKPIHDLRQGLIQQFNRARGRQGAVEDVASHEHGVGLLRRDDIHQLLQHIGLVLQ
jgi:hypothetical protein